MYAPSPLPADPKQLGPYVRGELERIARELSAPTITLTTQHVAPAKPRDGNIAKADGTDWNPGSGAGVYCYYGGAWVKLG